jgi:glucokinase
MNILGIDIGGTKIAVCIGNENGAIIAERRISTAGTGSPEAALQLMADTAKALIAEAGMEPGDIDAIGVGCPGPIDLKTQTLIEAPNMPGWKNVHIGKFFSHAFGRPVAMNNDANGAGLAEWMFGGCKGAESLIYVTMSTGIGAGIVINGRLVQGACDMAGEVGFQTLEKDGPAHGGLHGAFEAYCGGKRMADVIRAEITEQNIETAILEEAGSLDAINVQALREAMKKGDEYAVKKWDEFVERTAQGLGNLIMILNPEAIVLGTIAMHSGDLLMKPLKERLKKYTWPAALAACRIEPSVLTNIGELSALAIAIDGLHHQAEV